MSREGYSTWTDEKERVEAFANASSNLDSYDMVHGNRISTAGFGMDRNFIGVEPNISVRPSFGISDYSSFRHSESVPKRQRDVMIMCMNAYDKVGIVRNVIDLMSDFACQGMSIVHTDKSIEKFCRVWFNRIYGLERSERFLNYLYRIGNVIVERKVAKIKKSKYDELKTSVGNELIDDIVTGKREIPWQYEFINPVSIEVEKKANGDYDLYKRVSEDTLKSIKNNSVNYANLAGVIKNNRIYVDKSNTSVFYYKKDDWLPWANPMIYAILDDLIMLEKMKLADLAALDGAISNIRLWTLGDLEHKIIPKKPAIDKLRDILSSNVGGGTMDLVWGPDLKFQESNSQVYKFLGSEKYQPVLTSIYAGLGIPPTLTGAATGGGYTNNYVSLKTLIERLEYGRETLIRFWQHEFRILQKALGFKEPPRIHFDTIVLSDEAAMKNLMIQLVDRDIISEETLLERFKEIPEIEKVRRKREGKDRQKGNAPPKASPYHRPDHKEEVIKLAINKDNIDAEKYYETLDIPYKEPPPQPVSEPGQAGGRKAPVKNNGRPAHKGDSTKRKQKRVLPRSGSATAMWAINAQKSIAEYINSFALLHFNKKNIRSLTKAEYEQLEKLKLTILTSIEPLGEITEESIKKALDEGTTPSESFMNTTASLVKDFIRVHNTQPNSEDMKNIYALAYAELCIPN